jgi:hypothetical protein
MFCFLSRLAIRDDLSLEQIFLNSVSIYSLASGCSSFLSNSEHESGDFSQRDLLRHVARFKDLGNSLCTLHFQPSAVSFQQKKKSVETSRYIRLRECLPGKQGLLSSGITDEFTRKKSKLGLN